MELFESLILWLGATLKVSPSADHHAFAEIVREAWVALNEEPVYDATVVRDDIADIYTKRGIFGVGVLREQQAYLRVYMMRLVPPSQLPTTVSLLTSPAATIFSS